MSGRKPEDLTSDEIKEQTALYQRLYYNKLKDDPDHLARRRAAMKKYYYKKKSEREAEAESSTDEPSKKKGKERKYKKEYSEAIMLV